MVTMQERPWRGRVDFWEAPECASNAPLLGVPSAHLGYVQAVRVDLKLFIAVFYVFAAVFCSTQLVSSIAVPVVPLDPQEELIVTRDHS